MGIECEEHPVGCTTEQKEAVYNNITKTATIHFLEDSQFDPIFEKTFENKYGTIRKLLSRGFTKDGAILIRKNTRIGLKRLIKHEFGHLFGLNHTWNPVLMNRTWVFRWFDTPKIIVQKV
ncbi:MAG: hypothetical protein HeimC2_11400 [Candidatus Heimdallarchaeota archaeon LC_2]|nr:MAG: hypothetical protein HeimC2_11400 [Candidatus Heimdallarchaeota archaeon LC_2]